MHGRDERVQLDPRLEVSERLLGDRGRIAGEEGPHGLPRGGVGHFVADESAVCQMTVMRWQTRVGDRKVGPGNSRFSIFLLKRFFLLENFFALFAAVQL